MHEIILKIADEQADVQEAKDLLESKDQIRRKQNKAEKVIKVCERDLANIIQTLDMSNSKVRNLFKQNLTVLQQHQKVKKLRLKRNRVQYEQQIKEMSIEAKSGQGSTSKKKSSI